MEKYDLQPLRGLPIEEVAERLGLEVRRHTALCPFHDDHHASLSFHRGRNTYRCFVCGAHGGTIDLAMHVLRKDFREACQWLGGGLGPCGTVQAPSPHGEGAEAAFDAGRYARFFEHPWLSPEARRFLFDERRLDPRVVGWCRLGSWRDRQGTPWLQIPYFDREGNLVGIQNRNLAGNSPLSSAPRFRFPRGSECGIYNLPVLGRLREGDELWIAEGASDCWALLSAGHKAVAIPSATTLKPRDIDLLLTLNYQLSTEFHMAPDRDLPGERLFIQLRQLLPNLTHHQLPPDCKDYSEYYVKFKV